jgi:putative membrane-bound dehydrogenase-like protein
MLLVCLSVLAVPLPANAGDGFIEPYDTQKMTIPLLKPEEVLRTIRVPEGFKVSIFAAEPDVRQPISMTFDARGRLWVVENFTYAESPKNWDLSLSDRILIFEDPQHTGHFTKRTVFYDKLKQATSVEVGFGGVWVLAAPKLLFIPSKDGTTPSGEPIVMLDGFDNGPVGHNIVNGLHWGPDGWLYGRHGIQATSYVGVPGTPQSKRAALNASIWRFHPRTHAFEVVCRGGTNPWGNDWDDYGEMFFVNTVIGHLFHAIPGAYYKRMYGEHANPNLYQYLDMTADHWHFDTGKGWTASREGAGLSDALGGGHAHAGCMMYLGDNWPDSYRNTLFTLNFGGRRINNDLPVRSGAGYTAHHGKDMFFVGDKWFRGIELLYGPDGGVYICDWSDIGECHDRDGIHRNSGRIYKLTYGDPKRPEIEDVTQLHNLALVKLLTHKNDWYCRQARQLLQQRCAAGDDMTPARNALLAMYDQQTDPTRKLRAMWTLYSIGGIDEVWLRHQLKQENEHVRAWALRLLTDGTAPASSESIQAITDRAINDPSGLVQIYCASAMQRIGLKDRWPIAEALATRPEFANDPVLPLMTWYGIEASVPADPQRAVALAERTQMPLIRRHLSRRVTGELETNPAAVDSLVKLIDGKPASFQLDILDGMTKALRGWRKATAPAAWASVSVKLGSTDNAAVKALVTELSVVFGQGRAIEDLRRVLASNDEPTEARRQALRVLADSRDEAAVKLIQKVLSDRSLAPDAIRGLAQYGRADTGKLLISKFNGLGSDGRPVAAAVLCSRADDARLLVDAIASGKIAKTSITPFQVRQMRGFEDSQINEKLDTLWPELKNVNTAKTALIAKYKAQLTDDTLAHADASNGRQLFTKTCAVCHTLYGQGAKIAPDLTGANRGNLEYLLEHIMDPSATIPEAYKMYRVKLKDDRVIDGLMPEQNARTITLQTPTERLTIERSQIAIFKESKLSLMPEGLLEALPPDQVRDLIGYLMTTHQVPLPGEQPGPSR